MASAARQFAALGIKPKKPIDNLGPGCPAEIWYLWEWFCELSCGLAVTGMAHPVVTWEALESWARQMDIEVRPWEAVALVKLGQLRASVMTEEKPNVQPRQPPMPKKK